MFCRRLSDSVACRTSLATPSASSFCFLVLLELGVAGDVLQATATTFASVKAASMLALCVYHNYCTSAL